MLRILAERNRPHGQMLGEEAQEALQGEKHRVPVCDDLYVGCSCALSRLSTSMWKMMESQLFLTAPLFPPKNWRIPVLSLQRPPFPSRPSSTTATSGKICLSWASPSEPGCLS